MSDTGKYRRRFQGAGFDILLADLKAVMAGWRGSLAAIRRRMLRVALTGLLLTAAAFALDGRVQCCVDGFSSPEVKHWAREISSKAQPFKLPALLIMSMWLAGSVRRDPRLRQAAMAVLLSIAAAGLAVNVLRVVAGRARPYVGKEWKPLSIEEEFQSFPSAHTTVAFATAVSAAEAYPSVAPVLLPLAGAVGWSRIYLHDHHLSDVVAGAYVGTLVAMLFTAGLRRNGKSPRPEPDASGRG